MIIKLYCPYDELFPSEAVLNILEKNFPGQQLNKTISVDGDLININDRAAYIENFILDHGSIPILTNNDQENAIQYSGNYLSKDFGYAETDLWYILILIGDGFHPINGFIDLMIDLCSIIHPYWGTCNTKKAETIFTVQGMPENFKMIAHLGLPLMKHPRNFIGPEIPANLAWINCWSKKTIDTGILENSLYKNNIYKEIILSDGSMVVQVSEEPLDPNDHDHLERIKKLYELLPHIGGRA